MRDSLAITWEMLGGMNWTDKTEKYNQVPRKRLPFKHYHVNQLIYIKRVPKRFYKSQIEELEYHLSSKLQERFAGPFRITGVISPVLYRAMIHGKERVIHAINMKPARIQLDVTDNQIEKDEETEQNEEQDEDHNVKQFPIFSHPYDELEAQEQGIL